MNKKSKSPVPATVIKKTGFTFPEAIQLLIGGAKITRVEWANREEYGLLKDNFLMIHRGEKFHTWIVSEGDMMAQDWATI